MAYLDQRSGINQRAVIATAVALLEGAAILALVNGLAAHFMPPPPKHRLEGRTITMPLPPPPTPETEQPTPQKPTVQQDRQQQTTTPPLATDAPDLGQQAGLTVDFPLGPEPEVVITPPRPPLPTYTPQAPRPRNDPASWLGQNDYPTPDLRAGHQGSVRFNLTIGANGKVESCVVTESSGYRGLDQAACKYISSRARFEPATDGNGHRVTGAYSGRIRWVIPQD